MAIQMVLGKVYERLESKSQNYGGVAKECLPSIEVVGGSINIFISNSPTEPTNTSTMTESDANVGPGIFGVAAATKWIAVVLSSGTPTVFAQGIISNS